MNDFIISQLILRFNPTAMTPYGNDLIIFKRGEKELPSALSLVAGELYHSLAGCFLIPSPLYRTQ